MEKFTKESCIALLQRMQESLAEDRYPKRADFSEEEVEAIKAHLGPWPRALETAGLKPPREDDRLERNREKRIRAKRARTAAKKEAEKNKGEE